MIKKEFKTNVKSFIIWLSVLIIMFLMVYLIYPYIITSDTVKELDKAMEVFPKEMIKAFNMDMASITTAYGWLKTEGFMYILIIIGLYSSILGGNILLKEENDKTIEYLGSLPIKRSKIITNKIIVGIVLIVSMVLILGIFNYIALTLSGVFNQKEFILLSITPLLIGIPLFGINLFISTLFHKTKYTIGISLGLVFIFYLINILSELSKEVEFLKFFSIYTLADTRNIISNIEINPIMIIISIVISFIFIAGSYIIYNKKELI